MAHIDWRNELVREGHKLFLGGLPIAMHCHHYSINLQRTLEDTLGDQGIQILFQAAERASFGGFQSFLNKYSRIKGIRSKFDFASTLYQNAGLGMIYFQEVNSSGGTVISTSGHFVTGWLAKHGRRKTPGCHFARGWIAGILEAIYDKPHGAYSVDELRCKMMRDEKCIFLIRAQP